MNAWKEYKLGEITDWFSGGTPSKDKQEFWGGSIPWISAKTMTNYKVNSSELNITNEGLLNGSRLANENDILLLVRGSGLFNGIPINKVEKAVAFNQDIKAVRAKNPELQDFIFFWLHGNKKGLNDILDETGIGAGKFDTELLKNLDISIPPNKNEFNLIIQIAKSIFDKIDLLQQQNATLEKMAETLFRQWFVEEAKEEWEEKSFGDFVVPQKGKNITKAEAIDGPYPVVAGGLEPSCYHKESNTKAPVITISASGANAGYVRLYYNPVWSSDSSFIDSTITPYVYFSYVFLKSNQQQLFDKQEGSAQPHIYPSHIMELELLSFPESLIKLFEFEVRPYFEKMKSNKTQIKTLTKLRDNLLPKLMSGEVRVEM